MGYPRSWKLLVALTIFSVLLSSVPPLAPPVLALSPVADAPAISGPVVPAVVKPAVPIESPAVPHPEPPPPSLPAQATPPTPPAALHQLPLAFVPNQGQAPESVRFQLRAFGGSGFLTDDALVLTLPAPRPPDPPREPLPRPDTPPPAVPYRALRIAFVDASATTPRAAHRLPGATNAILGNDPKAWQRGLPSYADVVYPALYPGIDLHYTGDDGQLKRTYMLAPGADPSRIRWDYTGAADVRIGASGQLSVTLPLAEQTPELRATAVLTPATLVEQAPIAWQERAGRRVPIAVRYVIDQKQQVGFTLGAYDRSLPLTIDPTITYSTYLGGSSDDVACGLAVDAADAIYATGYTYSTAFPTTTGALSTTLVGNADVFVTKLDAAGDLVYSTYLGGSGPEYNPNACPGIAVHTTGAAYLAGVTASPNFPTVNAYDSTYHGDTDAFVAVLNAAGDDLVYSTYLGNRNDNYAATVAVDAAGIAYVAGSTCCGGTDPPFPTLNPYQGTYGGQYSDGFIAKLDPSASGAASLLYSTYLGGSGDDLIYGLALDADANIYVAGRTSSPSSGGIPFPVSPGAAQGSLAGQTDAFVFKLNNAGTTRLYGSYLGGNADDWGTGLAVDAYGQAAVVGWTTSTLFSPTANASQTSLAGGRDLFLAQLNASGTAWRLRTYLGGSGDDEGMAVTATRSKRLVVTGFTKSLDFPNAGDLQHYPDTSYGDALLSSFDSASGALLWSSQFGGSGREIGHALTTRSDGSLVVAGQSSSTIDFPLQDAVQATQGGAVDAFVTVLERGALPGSQENAQGCDCDAQHDWPFPVNTRTGNYWTRATDLVVAGTAAAPAIAFSRTYASQSITETISPLGYGWNHLYATRVITPGGAGGEPNRLIVLSPENNRLRYSALGNGDYVAWPGVYSRLEAGSGVYTQTLRSQAQYVFNATTGRLQDVYDAQGRALELTYNGGGQLTVIADALNASRALTLTYDLDGHIQTVSDGLREVEYSYSANDDLIAVDDVLERSTSYGYRSTPAPTHLLTSITNPIGQVVERVGYNGSTVASKVITQTLQDGSAIAFQYLSASTVITTTGTSGPPQVERIDYASDNSMTGRSVAGQTFLGTAYDESFSPALLVDGNGNTTQTAYSADGLPLVQTNALGQSSQARYDAHNNLLETTDAQGVTSRFRYDAQNNVISSTVGITTTSPLRATSLFTYTGDSQLLEQSGPDGVRMRYAYNGQGQVISTTVGYGTPLGQTTTYGYDALGRVVTITVGFATPLARQDVTRYRLDNSVQQTIQNYQNGIYSASQPDEDIVTTYGYDDLGRTVAVTDTLGHVSLTHYDTAGRVDWSMRNAVGASYDANGLPVFTAYSVATPDRNVSTVYSYDGLGRSTFVTETGILTGTFNTSTLQFSASTSRTTRTQYDGLSRPITTTLNYRAGLPSTADMNIPLYTRYDGASNVITQTDALGRWTVIGYDALNRPITTTLNYDDGDPLTGPADADIVSVTRYDTLGRVERTIDNAVNGLFTATEPITDRITLYQYDHFSRGITTTLNYDPPTLGSRTDTNRVSLSRYDPTTMRLQGQRDPLDQWISQQYDLLGRTTRSIQRCTGGSAPASCGSPTSDANVPTSISYDALGRTTVITDALAVASHTTYDDLGRSIATTQNWVAGGPTTAITNVTTLTRYDGLGRTLVMTDALGYRTRQSYNGLSQTSIVTDTMGRVTRMGYDGQGTLRWTKRHDGQLTLYQLDALGRTVATIANYQDGVVSGGEPSDQDLITRTVYDAGGRQLRVIDPAGRATAFTHDNLDRLITVTTNAASGGCPASPCNLQTQYQYDRLSNRTAIIDARGNLRRFAYDAVDRVVRAIDPLGNQNQWTYGGALLEEQALANGKNLEFWYDRLQRPNQVFSLEWAAYLETSYDGLGRRVQSSMPGGVSVTDYQYDPLGRMTQSAVSDIGAVNYGYDARGQRTQLEYPNGGPTLEYAYWPDGQLKVVTDTTTLASYSYDSIGRLAMVTRANGAVTIYDYDDADRLIDQHTTVGGVTRSRFQYTLNRLGQRTVVTETLGLSTRTISYGYDGQQRLVSANASTGDDYAYTYDDAGNRTEVWVNGSLLVNQSYNDADQVVGWDYDDAGNLVDDGTHTYAYDPLGWVIQRDGTTYGYNADGVLLTETTSGSTISYTQDLASPLSQMLQTIDGGTITDHLYGLDRLASEAGGTRTWYASDALGSLRQTLNNSGTVLSSVTYDPWGQVESGTTPGFGFTGEMQDSSGMVYLRARWYNPGSGTFTARDPFEGFDQQPYSLHPYQYGYSDPVRMTDPSGLCAERDEACWRARGVQFKDGPTNEVPWTSDNRKDVVKALYLVERALGAKTDAALGLKKGGLTFYKIGNGRPQRGSSLADYEGEVVGTNSPGVYLYLTVRLNLDKLHTFGYALGMSETLVVLTERVDDIPLLLAHLQRMNLPALLDSYFPVHGNRRGLSVGWTVAIWLTHILSQADHRLNQVQPWLERRLETLRTCTGQPLQPLDVTDDRLADVLRLLSDDTNWTNFERRLSGSLLRVYELQTEQVRLDSTTASGYWEVTEDGLFQFGHSKDRRPDLPQLKVMLSTLDPLGLPLAIDVLPGQRADDQLYLPAIARVRSALLRRGVLYVGDCKMAALETRAGVQAGKDFYLCPLSAVQLPPSVLTQYLAEARASGPSIPVERTRADGRVELIADAYERTETLTATVDTWPQQWTERRVLVRSHTQARSAEAALRGRVAQAQAALDDLLVRRPGKARIVDLASAQQLVARILARFAVAELLTVTVTEQVTQQRLRAYRDRPAGLREQRRLTLTHSLNGEALDSAIGQLGWRVYVTNQSAEQLPTAQVVLAYREEYLVERSLGRLKGTPLSLRPLYLERDDHATGLIRLLGIGLRVLTLLEFVVRRRLAQAGEQVSGLYAGNPKRATARPTTERLLEAFRDITLTLIVEPQQVRRHLTTLSPLQQRVLALLDFPPTVYSKLCDVLSQPP